MEEKQALQFIKSIAARAVDDPMMQQILKIIEDCEAYQEAKKVKAGKAIYFRPQLHDDKFGEPVLATPYGACCVYHDEDWHVNFIKSGVLLRRFFTKKQAVYVAKIIGLAWWAKEEKVREILRKHNQDYQAVGWFVSEVQDGFPPAIYGKDGKLIEEHLPERLRSAG